MVKDKRTSKHIVHIHPEHKNQMKKKFIQSSHRDEREEIERKENKRSNNNTNKQKKKNTHANEKRKFKINEIDISKNSIVHLV